MDISIRTCSFKPIVSVPLRRRSSRGKEDKKMKKNLTLRFTAAALTVAAIPFAITRAVQNPPDMNKLVAAAVDFTAYPAFASETAELGNGNLILYKPAPALTSETDADILTEESITQTETEKTEEMTAAEETSGEITVDLPEESADAEDTESIPEDITEAPETETLNPDSYIITQNISGDSEDLSVFNSRDLQVEHMTFESNNGTDFLWLSGGGQVRNCTELDNDFVKEQMKISPNIKIDAYSDQPQVLIVHTHACESYLTGDGDYQDEEYTCRTTDPSQSVVAVGQKIAEKLAENGICVIHDGTLHDYPSYNGSYDRAEETITGILNTYPSIKAVLDIHRDGIVEGDGTPVAAIREINGRKAAQVMIISAASDGYYHVPNYLDNFHFACLLQQYMESENNGITRPILFEYCQYNQHLTTGSLLIEIGSQGNTLEQALYSGELIGESIAKALLSLS